MRHNVLNARVVKGFLTASLLSIIMIMSGCDMIEYHPYDLDIDGEKHINETSIEQISKSTQGKKEIKFAVISDTQRWYDETEDAVEFINKMDDLDFVLHTGDISDFGLKMEFIKQRDILNKLRYPYVTIIGNHDCLGSGPSVFEIIFGEQNFSFDAGDVHFVCINTNGLEFERDEEVPNLTFIGEDMEKVDPKIKKTVLAMHAGPFSDQFNGGVCEVVHKALKEFPDFQFGVYGHGHHTSVDEFFNDGITYYECACGKAREMLRFTINEEGYTYEMLTY